MKIRFEGLRINREKQVAFLQVGAIGEMDLDNASRDLGLNRNDFARDGLADCVEVGGDVLRNCRGSRKSRNRAPRLVGKTGGKLGTVKIMELGGRPLKGSESRIHTNWLMRDRKQHPSWPDA